MIAPDRSLVRRWRDLVRARLAASPARRRRSHAGRAFWRRQRSVLVLRPLLPVAIFAAIWLGLPAKTAVRLGAVWTTAATFTRAAQLATLLHGPAALWMYYQIPASDRDVFATQWRTFRRAAIWLGADWLVFGAAVACHDGTVSAWLLAPIGALAQGLVALALALWAVERAPGAPYALGAVAGWILLWIGPRFAPDNARPEQFGGPLFDLVSNATPAGWVEHARRLAVGGHPVGWVVLLGVIAAAAGLIRVALRTLENNFSVDAAFPDALLDSSAQRPALAASTLAPSADDGSVDMPPASESARSPVGPARLAEALGRAPAQDFPRRGWIESIFHALLSPRQRTLVEFFRPTGLGGWTREFGVGVAILVPARLVHLAVGPTTAGTIITLGAFAAALPVFGGGWRGFEGQTVAPVALLPIGFFETVRLMLTANWLRTLLAAPLLLFGIRDNFTVAPLPWLDASIWTVWAILFLGAMFPFFAFVNFSRSSPDFSGRWWLVLLLIAVMLGWLLLFFVPIFVLAGNTIPSWFPMIAGPLALGVYSHVAIGVYGVARSRLWFDLVVPVRAV